MEREGHKGGLNRPLINNNMSIHKKLLEFQKLGISIKKDANNPHFKSKYADLSEVIGKVRPALTQCGIVMTQLPDEIGLITVLHDPDTDTAITGRINFIGASDMQKLGGAVTYARRYSLVTMLGLEDDDDDGNQAATKPPTAPKAPQAPAMTIEQAFTILRKTTDLAALTAAYKALPVAIRKDNEVIAVAAEVKATFSA
ncbi:ERF family protein [Novosphingobium aquae]|uniref:ERF family protein n=1 Tax=Novosphingobium aquae TaxID=3133435 RepID=A0ABU8SBU7_9SPHN